MPLPYMDQDSWLCPATVHNAVVDEMMRARERFHPERTKWPDYKAWLAQQENHTPEPPVPNSGTMQIINGRVAMVFDGPR